MKATGFILSKEVLLLFRFFSWLGFFGTVVRFQCLLFQFFVPEPESEHEAESTHNHYEAENLAGAYVHQ